MEFEEWLRTACFQKPTPEAYNLAKVAWNAATNGEREACAKVCESEALECPTDSEGDEAYDNAIRHAAAAIRMRSNK